MKQVYNLAGLMRKLKVDSFSELQERGYDVRGYLERREQELANELESVRHGLQELDARDEELARSQTQSELNEAYDNPFGRLPPAYPLNDRPPYPQQRASSDNDNEDTPFSSPRVSSRKYDFHDDDDTDLPSNFGFDPSGSYRDSDYVYIGT